jgi:hypothetical protein
MKKSLSCISVLFGIFFINLFLISVNAQELTKKWFPGHYLYVSPRNFESPMDQSNRALVKDNPYFTGYHARYHWLALEPSQDVYDFSIIEQDIETARADGKKLIIHLHDRDHSGQKVPYPEYITTDPVYEGGYYLTAGGKIMPKIWHLPYAERFGALIKALGNRFDQDSVLSYVCIEETALPGAKDHPDFTSAKLRDGYKTFYRAAAEGLPNTIFSQYSNYGSGLSRADADNMVAYLVASGNGLGCPDAYRKSDDGPGSFGVLDNWFGTYFSQYKGVMSYTGSSQSPSYWGNTPLIVLDYAIDKLNSQFMSWVPGTKESNKNFAFGIVEVIEMVNAEQGRIVSTPPLNIRATTSILNERHNTNQAFSVYSNPTIGDFIVRANDAMTEGFNYQLIDLAGRVLDTQKVNGKSATVSMNNLSRGTYLLRVENDNKILEVKKVIKGY